MFKIQNITTAAKQKQVLILPDGTSISFSIEYIPLQIGWFIREISYNDFVLNGVRISNSPNLLYQYRNQIPFGLACFSTIAEREPTLQEDFFSDASKLYILTEAEVADYARYLSGQV